MTRLVLLPLAVKICKSLPIPPSSISATKQAKNSRFIRIVKTNSLPSMELRWSTPKVGKEERRQRRPTRDARRTMQYTLVTCLALPFGTYVTAGRPGHQTVSVEIPQSLFTLAIHILPCTDFFCRQDRLAESQILTFLKLAFLC